MPDLIVIDPSICSGKPVIRGTRIMVKNILGMFAGGYTMERVLAAYPELTSEMVGAALEYAAQVIDEEQVVGLGQANAQDPTRSECSARSNPLA